MKDALISCDCTEDEFRRAAYILNMRVYNHKYYDFNYVVMNSDLIQKTGENSALPRGEKRRWMVDHWNDPRLSNRDIEAFVGERTFELYPKLGLPRRTREGMIFPDDKLKKRVEYLEEKQAKADRRYYMKYGIHRKDYLAQQAKLKEDAEKAEDKDSSESAE